MGLNNKKSKLFVFFLFFIYKIKKKGLKIEHTPIPLLYKPYGVIALVERFREHMVPFLNCEQSVTMAVLISNNIISYITDFIYITDGQGWDSDLSHLKNIIKSIKYVFNFSMIQAGYLEHLIQSSN